MTDPRADYDSPWKQALEVYFMNFMAFFFPEIYTDIDWSRSYEFLDQELQKIVRDAELGKRFADKLVKIWRVGGEETYVLAHIEVQGQSETNFTKRIDVYNYRISDRYNKPVVSLVVLADERESWRPDEYRFELWGFRKVMHFPIVKLLDYGQQWQMLENSSNPFATVVMAHLKAKETSRNYPLRKQWKLRLTRRLYEQGYQRQDVLNLFLFIDWLMSLPDQIEASFLQELEQYEREKQMPYVTSIERKAEEKGRQAGIQAGRQAGIQTGRQEGIQTGRQQGLLEGVLESIELGLELKFGQEGLQLFPEISQISDLAVLREIQSGLRQFNSLDELRAIYTGSM